MKVTLDIPENAFSVLRLPPQEFAREMRMAATAKWYELRKISQSKGAEICGVSRLEFLHILGVHHVSVLQYDDELLQAELAP